jgi:hypothetical protein
MSVTAFPQNQFGGLLMNTYLELVCGDSETHLVLKSTGNTGDTLILARYRISPYELFRPDQDAHFFSRNGRVWSPE